MEKTAFACALCCKLLRRSVWVSIALLHKMKLQEATLLSDNQQLVLNGTNLSNSPDWRTKPYTQTISSFLWQPQTLPFAILEELRIK
jgi:hypothetical protein